MSTKKLTLLILTVFAFGKAMAQKESYEQIISEFDKYDYEAKGTLFPYEGEPITGVLEYSFLGGDKVYLQVINEKGKLKKEKFDSRDIKGFHLDTLGGMAFEVVKSYAIGGGRGSFYQNITPNGGEKIKLYRTFITEGLVTTATADGVDGRWEFAALFPGEEKVISLEDIRVKPMEKKLPKKYLSDCPELAKKVENKEEGYYLETNPLKFSKLIKQAKENGGISDQYQIRCNIYSKIISEYNSCQ